MKSIEVYSDSDQLEQEEGFLSTNSENQDKFHHSSLIERKNPNNISDMSENSLEDTTLTHHTANETRNLRVL